jgi:hypothetical protein
MCDYSLDHVRSRPAVLGDRLISTRFLDSCTRGFASMSEPNVAVCLLPGTELAFDKELRREGTFFFSKKFRHKVARFRAVNEHRPDLHHDALELPDGQIVLVTELKEGQHATVLQLPVRPRVNTLEPQRLEKHKNLRQIERSEASE